MTAAIPEVAGTAVGAGETAVAASGPARAGGAARGARAAPVAPRRQKEGGEPRGGQQRERQYSRKLKKTGKGALKARLPGSHSYQPVILAEFLVAVVVVSTGPLAKGGTPEAQAKGSPSPYSVNTLKQLVAIGGVYFVLALLASSRRAGRMSAWFGGLVLLGLGFTQLANGDLQAVFKIFGPSAAAQSPAAPAGQGSAGSLPGITQGIPAGVAVPQDAAGAFPVIEPGGTIVPAQASITPNVITVPSGQSGVITSGPGPGVNLA